MEKTRNNLKRRLLKLASLASVIIGTTIYAPNISNTVNRFLENRRIKKEYLENHKEELKSYFFLDDKLCGLYADARRVESRLIRPGGGGEPAFLIISDPSVPLSSDIADIVIKDILSDGVKNLKEDNYYGLPVTERFKSYADSVITLASDRSRPREDSFRYLLSAEKTLSSDFGLRFKYLGPDDIKHAYHINYFLY